MSKLKITEPDDFTQLCPSLFDELLFAVPDDIKEGNITIDKDYVNQQLESLVKDKDLSPVYTLKEVLFFCI